MQKTLFICLVLFSILSCKKKIEDASTDTALTASWNLKDICTSISGGYAKMYYDYTDVDVTQTVSVYSDSGCSVPLIVVEISGQYQISNLVSGFFDDKWDLDTTLSAYTLEPKSTAVVNSYNSASYCGYNNWAINSVKNVTGHSCGGAAIPDIGEVEYGFVVFTKVTVSGGPFTDRYPGDMYFGKGDSSHDGRSPEQRYNVHDLTYIFVK